MTPFLVSMAAVLDETASICGIMVPYPLLPRRKEVASSAKGGGSLIGSKYEPGASIRLKSRYVRSRPRQGLRRSKPRSSPMPSMRDGSSICGSRNSSICPTMTIIGHRGWSRTSRSSFAANWKAAIGSISDSSHFCRDSPRHSPSGRHSRGMRHLRPRGGQGEEGPLGIA